jgi:CMP-N,N'-diacetyllegionaminic acid synthase
MGDALSNTVAVVLARGGSKGIPGKNIIRFCRSPLLQWTVGQLQYTKEINSIWVSSDSDEILTLASILKCKTIKRPANLSGDRATSEEGLLHALEIIERVSGKEVDVLVHPQVTSPIRHIDDFSKAIALFKSGGFDSMFSASPAKDLCLWSRQKEALQCESYNKNNPNRRRQETFGERYIENGSFYIMKPEVLKKTGVRFGNNVGVYLMKFWEMFEIDEPEDLNLCEVIFQAFMENRL